MTDTSISRLNPPPLPATVADLLAQRKSMRARSLNDNVDECHLKLWDNPEYRQLFLAIHPAGTVKGSFPCDNTMAAEKIRRFAVNNRIPIAAGARLAEIVFSLHVVCRRYGMSRRDRRNSIGGEPVGEMNEAAE